MHGYYWSPKVLKNELKDFEGGQFRLWTPYDIYRGKVHSVEIPGDRRQVLIIFEWLCTERRIFNGEGVLVLRWSLITPPPRGYHCIDLEYSSYYRQADEDRLKIKGKLRESCHFFKKDDYTNLEQIDGEFVPYYKSRLASFKKSVLIALLTPS